jgi:hypothetical protein
MKVNGELQISVVLPSGKHPLPPIPIAWESWMGLGADLHVMIEKLRYLTPTDSQPDTHFIQPIAYVSCYTGWPSNQRSDNNISVRKTSLNIVIIKKGFELLKDEME